MPRPMTATPAVAASTYRNQRRVNSRANRPDVLRAADRRADEAGGRVATPPAVYGNSRGSRAGPRLDTRRPRAYFPGRAPPVAFSPDYVRIVLNENFEDAKSLFLAPLMAIHYAHLTMLVEQGIVSPADARVIRDALDRIDQDRVRQVAYDGTYED